MVVVTVIILNTNACLYRRTVYKSMSIINHKNTLDNTAEKNNSVCISVYKFVKSIGLL